MNIKTGKLKQLLLALTAVLALAPFALGLAACGGTPAAVADAGCSPRFDVPTKQVIGNDGCRVNVAVGVDMTSTGVGTAVSGVAVNDAVQGAIDHTLMNGGRLSVGLFGSSSARSLNLVDVTAAGPGEAADLERIGNAKQLVAGMNELLTKVYSAPARQPAKLRRALSTVRGSGTDLSRAVRDLVDVATSQDGGSAIVLVTDGLTNSDYDTAALVRSGESPRSLARLLGGSVNGRRVDLAVMRGVGNVAPHLRARWTPARTDRLLEAWRIACKSFARRCVITTDIS